MSEFIEIKDRYKRKRQRLRIRLNSGRLSTVRRYDSRGVTPSVQRAVANYRCHVFNPAHTSHARMDRGAHRKKEQALPF